MPSLQSQDNSTARVGGDPHVTILMGVRNGAGHLAEQLESFEVQSHGNWALLASDDGSQDDSRAILNAFAAKHAGRHAVTCLIGPGRGAAANFLSLLKVAPAHMPPDGWLAFSDQDDIWLPERLARGVTALSAIEAETPALYCSRTWVVDENLRARRLSVPHRRGPSFANALVQNIAAGNTILMNAAGARLLCSVSAEVGEVVMHDWWAYQVISGAGGLVLHDDAAPTLLYRQHGANVLGVNTGLQPGLARLLWLLRGKYRGWNSVNMRALAIASAYFTPENQAKLEQFRALRQAGLAGRLVGLRGLGLHRQTKTGTLALWFAALANRL